MRTLTPLAVLQVLSEAKIDFAMIESREAQPRSRVEQASEEVEFVIARQQVLLAAKILRESIANLAAVYSPLYVMLHDRDVESVSIRLMKPLQQPYCEVLHNLRCVSSEAVNYRVPTLEMALVLKFASLVSPYRAEVDKHRDAQEFEMMVINNPDFDRDKLSELGNLLYPNAGKSVLKMARRVLAGERLMI